MSMLNKKPVHVEGDWFVWTNQVMTKRMLLGVILRMTFGHNNSMAANKVAAHYETVKNQIPVKYQISNVTHTGSQLISTFAGSVMNSIITKQTDHLDLHLDASVMQKHIVDIFGQEYESK